MQKLDELSQRFWSVPKRLLERYHAALFLAAIFGVGLVARWFFVPHISVDMNDHLLVWWHDIIAQGGFAALANLPGDYTPPYPTLMALMTYTGLVPLVAIKLINTLGDILLAITVYLLVKQVGGSALKARIACAAVFLLPTVVLNSVVWGQCDAIYTSFLLLFLYSYLRKRPAVAMLFYGMAVAFKLQAIFLAPLILVLVVAGRLKLRQALLSLVSYAVLFLPSILAGAPFSILWTVYLDQSKSYNTGMLTLEAPNIYMWLNPANADMNKPFVPGFMLGGLCVVGVFCYWLWMNRAKLNTETLFCAMAFIMLLVPFVMPKMHERYFYPADILLFAFAMLYPKKWYLAVIMQLSSLASYNIFLLAGKWELPAVVFSLGLLACLATLGLSLYKAFRGENVLSLPRQT